MFMNNRFNDGSTFLATFTTRFFVHCPKFQKMATVALSSNEIVRMSCLNYGFFKNWSGTQTDIWMFSNHAAIFEVSDY